MKSKDLFDEKSNPSSQGITMEHPHHETDDNLTLKLREEKLDISKRNVQTCEVRIRKEILTEEKNITVPITREELIIEKIFLDSSVPSESAKHNETIRIPISEECIEISKHPVKLQEVTAYRNQFQETKHITEMIKKEKAHVKTTGNVKVIDK